jgi:serine protease Do
MIKRYSFLLPGICILSSIALATTSFISNSSSTTQQEVQTNNYRPKEALLDFRGVAKKARPAVVSIRVQSKKSTEGVDQDGWSEDPFDLFGNNDIWGLFGIPRRNSSRSQPIIGQASGVIISPDGYILTNSHVVNDMDQIFVQLTDGREFKAKVLGEDPNSDLALIKIEAEDDLPYLELSNSDDLEIGQWVAAIGNPFGLQATLTVGVVSAKGRNNLDLARYEDFIQTDAAINRGNSGGPLVNLNGEIVGINTAIATNAALSYMGVGFAIPSNMARYVIDEIKTHGKVTRGFLGVNLQSIDYDLARAFGLKKVEGALVTHVLKNSPADHAGLRAEDIILQLNGRPIENAGSLRNAVYMMPPGTQVNLRVLRDNQILQISLEVGDYKEDQVLSRKQKSQLGIEVGPLTPDIAQTLGYTNEKGVVITKIQSGSLAALAGLKKGALILSVNRQKISNPEEFYDAIDGTPADHSILLQIKQGERYLFVSLRAN